MIKKSLWMAKAFKGRSTIGQQLRPIAISVKTALTTICRNYLEVLDAVCLLWTYQVWCMFWIEVKWKVHFQYI